MDSSRRHPSSIAPPVVPRTPSWSSLQSVRINQKSPARNPSPCSKCASFLHSQVHSPPRAPRNDRKVEKHRFAPYPCHDVGARLYAVSDRVPNLTICPNSPCLKLKKQKQQPVYVIIVIVVFVPARALSHDCTHIKARWELFLFLSSVTAARRRHSRPSLRRCPSHNRSPGRRRTLRRSHLRHRARRSTGALELVLLRDGNLLTQSS